MRFSVGDGAASDITIGLLGRVRAMLRAFPTHNLALTRLKTGAESCFIVCNVLPGWLFCYYLGLRAVQYGRVWCLATSSTSTNVIVPPTKTRTNYY